MFSSSSFADLFQGDDPCRNEVNASRLAKPYFETDGQEAA